MSLSEVVAVEDAGVVAAVAVAVLGLALGHRVPRFVCDVLVVRVTTAAFATQHMLLHRVAFFLRVAFPKKAYEIALLGTAPITSDKIRSHLRHGVVFVVEFFPDLGHTFSVTNITKTVHHSQEIVASNHNRRHFAYYR